MKKYLINYNQVKQVEIEAKTKEKARELFLNGEWEEEESENLGIDCENFDIEKINQK